MAQICNHCGKSFESTATICPYCQKQQATALPSVGGQAGVDNAYAGDDAEQLQVVTAPVRKKRSLPMSCLMGFLIFAPTILLVAFLMHFYFQQNRLREMQELKRTPIVDKANTEKILTKLSNAMEQLVLNAQPELIEKIRAQSQDVLLITVKPEWNDLPELTRKDLEKRWLSKWQQLDGTQIEIGVEETNDSSVEGE